LQQAEEEKTRTAQRILCRYYSSQGACNLFRTTGDESFTKATPTDLPQRESHASKQHPLPLTKVLNRSHVCVENPFTFITSERQSLDSSAELKADPQLCSIVISMRGSYDVAEIKQRAVIGNEVVLCLKDEPFTVSRPSSMAVC
jgi:hypothetical protein